MSSEWVCRGQVGGFGCGDFRPVEIVEGSGSGVEVYMGESDFDTNEVFEVADGKVERAGETVFAETATDETTLDLEGGLVDDGEDRGEVGGVDGMRFD